MEQGNGFLNDTDGGQSSMRLAMMLVVIVVLSGWLYVVIKTGTFVDFPSGTVWILGLSLTGKLVQKGVELMGVAKGGGSNGTTGQQS